MPIEFDYLLDLARSLGAVDARIIPACNVIVENRVRLKCQVGCAGYGKKLTCPPYVPSVDEFRKMLAEYHYALIVKFHSTATADEQISLAPQKMLLDMSEPKEAREKAAKFWDDYFTYSKSILPIMLELEKTAFNHGNTFAISFVPGSCRLCEKCNLENKMCIHPTMARIPEHAVGINIKKTADDAGMPVTFPFRGQPDAVTIMLID
jgi:predicted metal-binding protein